MVSNGGDGTTPAAVATLGRRASGPDLSSFAVAAAAGSPHGALGRRRAFSNGGTGGGLKAYAAAMKKEMQNESGRSGVSSLFRSEDMVLLRLYLDRSAAHCTVDELGELGVCQFLDLNSSQSPFQRTFSTNVRRCDDMLRICRFLTDQIADIDGLNVAPAVTETADDSTGAVSSMDGIRLDDLDAHLRSLECALLEMNANAEALKMQYNQAHELRAVLEKSAEFFNEAPRVSARSTPASSRGGMAYSSNGSGYGVARAYDPLGDGSLTGLLTASGSSARGSTISTLIEEFQALSSPPEITVEEADRMMAGDALSSTASRSAGSMGASSLLSCLTGTIEREKVAAFERMLFRATHGNCYVRSAEIKGEMTDPVTQAKMKKSVFIIFFAGSAVHQKASKICDAFEANKYTIPEEHNAQMAALLECRARLNDLEDVERIATEQRRQTLTDVAASLATWRYRIRREMGVFNTLNLLNYDTSNRLFIADAWCPQRCQEAVRSALEIGQRRSNAQVSSVLQPRLPERGEIPPTSFRTNRFTSVFQSIVESYGVAKYKEANPAPYTIVTFPFLFAVMFGDIGHGIMMAMFAFYLVRNEKRLGASRQRLNEMLVTCFDGRYLILLMGLFSIFTGFIYNEFFAVPLDIFGTRWKFTTASSMACGIDNCDVPAAVMPPLKPYPLGFDPVWKTAKTGLVFFNSYKMKLSIVLGVTQMVLGIFLSYTNARFTRNRVDVLFVFIPQMLFMLSIFGYLVFMILLKWLIDYNAPSCVADPTCEPPDLKTVLIGMFMSPGTVAPEMVLFPGQAEVQSLLLLVAVVAVPWMLFPKPLILRARHMRSRIGLKGKKRAKEAEVESLLPTAEQTEDTSDDHADAFDFGEVFVHQMIHTIEFVLGAVSNTASYLRLWALSLAHAELSNVFLEKLIFGSIASANPILMMVGFFMWLSMTVGVLMGMESLSAFLHALRLHWVEFQNKFYLLEGDGKKFEPFSHARSVEEEE